jgi:uncharacterized SAM-binding protein YcdF (DUF218 family)
MIDSRFISAVMKTVVLAVGIYLAATQHFAHSVRISSSPSFVSDHTLDADQPIGVVVATGGAGRIAAGLRLMLNHTATRMLISGTGEGVQKADIIKLIVAANVFPPSRLEGIMACCVDLGPSATNTRGNAIDAQIWAETHGLDRLVVVTADYHLPRTMMVFAGQMPHQNLSPHAVPTPWLVHDWEGQSGWWKSPKRIGIIGGEMIKFYASKLQLI